MADPITARKSQRSPHDPPWWWITGDTYPHRALLKQQGARFSKRRQAWYFKGAELPPAIQHLIPLNPSAASVASEPDDPCSVESAAVLLGMRVKPLNGPREDSIDRDEAEEHRHGTVSSASASSEGTEMPDAPGPRIRVTKPLPFPSAGDPLDALQTAVQAAKTLSIGSSPTASGTSNKLKPIGQAYCGELTGSVSGQVYCYGYVRRESVRNNC